MIPTMLATLRTAAASAVLALAGCGTTESMGPCVPVATRAHAGEAQMGFAGSALTVAPAVRVNDAAGRGVPGMSVSFVVVSGSGSVASPTTSTDQDGVARSGVWTLGAEVGHRCWWHGSTVWPR